MTWGTARWVAVVAVAACGAARAGGEKSKTVSELGPVTVGKASPPFAGLDLNGDVLSLRKVAVPKDGEPASVVIVSFFATTCVPCKKGLPAIVRVQQELAAKRVRLVLIAQGEKSEVVRSFLDELKLSIPVILDPYLEISTKMGVTKVPRTFVIDGDGRVRTIFQTEGIDFERVLRAAVTTITG